MLCLSGFELYSRWVPLICLEAEVIFEKIDLAKWLAINPAAMMVVKNRK